MFGTLISGLFVPATQRSTFANGMEWVGYGEGPRTIIWIPGGPGAEVPTGMSSWLLARQVRPLLDAGYRVVVVSRRRHMPTGHTVEAMAADYAALIDEEFGGYVEAVVGLSYGGMIVQYLAADHPGCAGHFVIALSAGRISEWGRDVDYRWAMSKVFGDARESATVMAEYVFPEPADAWRRRLVGAAMAPLSGSNGVPPQDLLVEAEAEMAFDSRSILPRISVPVLLVTAENDLFFTPQIIEETVELLPHCTVVTYPGMGHVRAYTSPQLAHDVLDHLTA